MNVLVKYGRLVDLEAALRCRRCEGGGRERFGPDAGATCPRCDGSGRRADGWAYQANGLTLNVGDLVEVPPTPRSVPGRPVFATVVALDAEFEGVPKSRVLRLVEPGLVT